MVVCAVKGFLNKMVMVCALRKVMLLFSKFLISSDIIRIKIQLLLLVCLNILVSCGDSPANDASSTSSSSSSGMSSTSSSSSASSSGMSASEFLVGITDYMALDKNNRRIIVLSRHHNSIYAYDLDNGLKTLISKNDLSLGPRVHRPMRMTLASPDLAYVNDISGRILSVDLNTGMREEIFDIKDGTANRAGGMFALYYLNGLSVAGYLKDTAGAAPIERVMKYENDTFDFVSVNNDSELGPSLSSGARSIAGSTSQNKLFVSTFAKIYSIELDTGLREELTPKFADINSNFYLQYSMDFDDDSDTLYFGNIVRSVNDEVGPGIYSWNSETDDVAFIPLKEQIRRGAWVRSVLSDNQLNSLYYAEASQLEIMRYDLTEKTHAALFTNNNTQIGSGPQWVSPDQLFPGGGPDVYVFDGVAEQLFRVDLMTGNRELLIDLKSLNYQDLYLETLNLSVAGIDLPNSTIYINHSDGELFALDWVQGELVLISNDKILIGDREVSLSSDLPHVLDNANNRVLTLLGGDIVATDLSDGARSFIPDLAVQSTFGQFSHIKLSVDGNKLWVFDNSQFLEPERPTKIAFIDLQEKTETLVSHEKDNEGPEFDYISRVAAADEGANILYVLMPYQGAIYRVDINSGTRTEMSGPNVGQGPPLSSPTDALLDKENNRLIVTDSSQLELLAVDLTTGDRAVLSR